MPLERAVQPDTPLGADRNLVVRLGGGVFYERLQGNMILNQINYPPELLTPKIYHGNLSNEPAFGFAWLPQNQDPARCPVLSTCTLNGDNALPFDLLRPYAGYTGVGAAVARSGLGGGGFIATYGASANYNALHRDGFLPAPHARPGGQQLEPVPFQEIPVGAQRRALPAVAAGNVQHLEPRPVWRNPRRGPVSEARCISARLLLRALAPVGPTTNEIFDQGFRETPEPARILNCRERRRGWHIIGGSDPGYVAFGHHDDHRLRFAL
jgi:hypothetical protein